MALFYTLLLIGLHPQVQERLHREVDDLYRKRNGTRTESDMDFSKDEEEMILKPTSFLEAVIKESLRLYPPVPRIGRKLKREVHIRGSESGVQYVIPEGTTVTIDIFQIHRQSSLFPCPDTFDPNRFMHQTTGSGGSSARSAFMPFSLGARSCIGSKYAMLEMKIFLTRVLKQFTIVSQTTVDQLNLAVEIVLKPCGSDVEILFLKR